MKAMSAGVMKLELFAGELRRTVGEHGSEENWLLLSRSVTFPVLFTPVLFVELLVK